MLQNAKNKHYIIAYNFAFCLPMNTANELELYIWTQFWLTVLQPANKIQSVFIKLTLYSNSVTKYIYFFLIINIDRYLEYNF